MNGAIKNYVTHSNKFFSLFDTQPYTLTHFPIKKNLLLTGILFHLHTERILYTDCFDPSTVAGTGEFKFLFLFIP